MKKWGRVKIARELEAHGLTNRCIKIGLREIEHNDYLNTMKLLIEKKWQSTSLESNLFKRRDKTARYAISKGFEPEMVWEIVKGAENQL